MKKWKLVLISILAGLALLVAAGVSLFHFYILPRYIEPMFETAARILNDEEVKQEISEMAQELSQKGLIDARLDEKYINSVSKMEDDGSFDVAAQAENGEDSREDSVREEYQSQNSVGAKNVKIQDGEEKKYSYSKSSSSKTDTPSQISTESMSAGEKVLFERFKSEVSAKDMARIYEIYSKIDMNKVRSLLSNRAALKAYIQSALSETEYSDALELYLKYSYLIK